MRRAFAAELLKLRRRSVIVAAAVIAVAYAVLTTLVAFLSAEMGEQTLGARGVTTTLESLARPEGVATAFGDGIAFLGVILLAVFISNIGFEYARGTFAGALMKQPRRLRLLGGKMVALLVFLAAALVVAEVAGVLAGVAIAPLRDVSTSAWFSSSGLVDGIKAFGTAMFVVSAWAGFGMAVAIFTRSVPIALGVGLAWAGPIEHIVQRSWQGASSWFPGLLLEGASLGGTNEVSSERAFLMALTYATLLVAAAVVSFGRRDVTV